MEEKNYKILKFAIANKNLELLKYVLKKEQPNNEQLSECLTLAIDNQEIEDELSQCIKVDTEKKDELSKNIQEDTQKKDVAIEDAIFDELEKCSIYDDVKEEVSLQDLPESLCVFLKQYWYLRTISRVEALQIVLDYCKSRNLIKRYIGANGYYIEYDGNMKQLFMKPIISSSLDYFCEKFNEEVYQPKIEKLVDNITKLLDKADDMKALDDIEVQILRRKQKIALSNRTKDENLLIKTLYDVMPFGMSMETFLQNIRNKFTDQ